MLTDLSHCHNKLKLGDSQFVSTRAKIRDDHYNLCTVLPSS